MSEGLGYGTDKPKPKNPGRTLFSRNSDEGGRNGRKGSRAVRSPQRVGAGRLCFAIASGWALEEPGKDLEMICDLGLSRVIPLLKWIS